MDRKTTEMMQNPSPFRVDEKGVAYVSTYPPRECGIANFTKDLIDAVDHLHKFRPPVVIAINEKGAIYNYNRRVRFQIERDSIDDHVQAARYINLSEVSLVNLQHEFGLFGGEWGEFINSFLGGSSETSSNYTPHYPTKLRIICPNGFGKPRTS